MLLRKRAQNRMVHVHIGPHKTGSTAIQRDLDRHAKIIQAKLGLTPFTHESLWGLANAMNKQDMAGTQTAASDLIRACNSLKGDLILSCEDLSGELPCRGQNRRIYPHLRRMLKNIDQFFQGANVKFYFFERDPEAWLQSVYAQLLKHRTKFKGYDKFLRFVEDKELLWDGLLEGLKKQSDLDLIAIKYEEGAEFSSTEALLSTIVGPTALSVLPDLEGRPNRSPPPEIITLLERANKSGASSEAIQAAKLSIWEGKPHHASRLSIERRPSARGNSLKPDWLSPELEALWSRVGWGSDRQTQPNLLPPTDADLSKLRLTVVEAEGALPEVSRARMQDQAIILAHRFKGLPGVCNLLGMVISYLRRSTDHEEHASLLFQRLWEEEHRVLLGFLPTRWLISTLQTFMEHGINEDQRLIGAAGFFFSNTIKLYECERAIEGLDANTVYEHTLPQTKSGFWGLDRFRVGGTDLMLNTNAHLLALASNEDRAGRVLQEFLLRVKRHNTAFSRMDRTRQSHSIDTPPFSDCWSFFEPPEK